jgi:aspartyl-tRNA(Asn)/glutamyl-tRNA(Gln) amidotransferase subunit A
VPDRGEALSEAPGGDLAMLPLSELSPLIRKRELAAVDVADAVLKRIRRLDDHLHAYITVDEEGLLAAAHALDEGYRRNPEGRYTSPLHGIPISVKDQFATKGIPTTLASRAYSNNVPDFDAAVVGRLHEAGALLAGKANMYELATGWGTFGHYPVALNPWDDTCSPGGSSSGSAVGVSTGMAHGSLASDGGGSTRIPASYCGVVGLKPSSGRISNYGSLPMETVHDGRPIRFSKTIGVPGIIARRVRDVALILQAVSGADPRDAGSVPAPVEDFAAGLTGALRGLKVGVPWAYIEGACEAESESAFRAALEVLRHAGARLVTVTTPPTLASVGWMWTTIAYVEMAALFGAKLDEKPEHFGPELHDRIKAGRTSTAENYFMATQARAQLRLEWLELHRSCDVIATPTAPSAAPTVDELLTQRRDLENIGELARYTRPYNMTGLPAISVPCGFSMTGLPFGLQFGGRPMDEVTLLRVADAFERRTQWHRKLPPAVTVTSISPAPAAR